MNSNRVNLTLTFSAALAGLALTVLTPLAHGHGNNPKLTSDTDPNTGTTPPPPPVSGHPTFMDNSSGMMQLPTPLGSIADPGIGIDVDVTILNANDVLSKVLSAPVPIDIVISPDPLDQSPRIAVDFTGGTGGGVITTPMSSVIPAPGTLALIGLAGVAAGRRRRRRR